MATAKEILQQVLATFREVLRDPSVGELYVHGELPRHWRHVFASVQSPANRSLSVARVGTLQTSVHGRGSGSARTQGDPPEELREQIVHFGERDARSDVAIRTYYDDGRHIAAEQLVCGPISPNRGNILDA